MTADGPSLMLGYLQLACCEVVSDAALCWNCRWVSPDEDIQMVA